MLVVGYHVGSRADELRQLRWENVDLKARQIHLRGQDPKNKRPRTLPIYADMEPWLQMAWDEHQQKYPDCPYVFHYLNRPIGSHMKGWSKAATAAGVPGLLFHDLRRSAVRNLERAGVPRKIAMQITGHTTEAVYRRYDIVSPRDLELAGPKMTSYLEGQALEKAASPSDPVTTVSKGLN